MTINHHFKQCENTSTNIVLLHNINLIDYVAY